MAASSAKFDLDTKKKIRDKAPNGLKETVDSIFKNANIKEGIFGDSNWPKTKTRQWQFKVNPDEFERIAIMFGEKPGNTKGFVTKVGDYKLKFLYSKKTSAKAPDAATTRKQEIAAAWVIRAALNHNANFKSGNDIAGYTKPVKVDGKVYKSIYEIYPDVEPDWLNVFYKQQSRILEELKKKHFSEFRRDVGFMSYISGVVKDKFGISQKDNWNPADIWAIRGEKNVIKIIDQTIDGNGSQTIIELNAVLRKMFQEHTVVGISLKKIGGMPKWETYNIKEMGLKDTYNYSMDTKPRCELGFANGEFTNMATKLVVNGNGAAYDFQIQGNDTTKMSNLKYEPTETGARSARMGKAPVAMVAMLFKDNKISKNTYSNDHNKYPKTVAEFNENKYAKWEDIFNDLKGKVEMEVNTASEFTQNMANGFLSSKPWVATSKLIQLKFLHTVLNMKPKKRNEFLTDMVFLAAKKGKRFGPFGKLY